jgi:hypothetical protein
LQGVELLTNTSLIPPALIVAPFTSCS